jgi:hypothetical protein
LKLPDILWVPVDVQGDIQYATIKTRDDNGNIKGWTQLQTQKAGSTTLVGLPTKLLDKKGELQVGSTYYDGTGYHYATRSYNLQDQGDTGEVVTNPARNITVEDVVETTDNDQWTWYADTGGTGIGDMPLFQHTLTKTTDVLIGAGCDVGSLPKTVYIRRIKPTQTDWIPIPLDGDGKYRNTFDSGRYQLYFEGFLNGPGPDWVDPYWLYSDGEKG